MVLFAILCRVSDGLILSESMDTLNPTFDKYRLQAKVIFGKLSRVSDKAVTIDVNDKYYFAYIIEHEICYLSFCEKSYSKKLTFKFLDELAKEFYNTYGFEVPTAKRPYQFIAFESFITKTKKQYQDTRTQKNLSNISTELEEVRNIMTKNIKDIVGRGEKLSDINQKSELLLADSVKYEKQTVALSSKLFFKKYGPILIIANSVKEVNDFIIRYFDDNPHYSRILSFHVIAGGASHLGYHLRLLNENRKYHYLLNCIKGVVIDSGPFSNAKTISKIFKKDLLNSGNFAQYLLSLFLPIFIPVWMYYEKYDYPYLISCNQIIYKDFKAKRKPI
ncbi:hypothetical protein DICPUDRAFT_146775 [Dictyostelium purpureum]|uniref:Longin domain-containing protein n=1 Tax=Dictyostelium purpureum TaxID=5786 RepID=F0Z6Q2_DICPU|nr:uncharacterized protein DICPUDRAFT_146775 [Dictyostelium purpureum]EGC40400.1 hypothetical protein DICPUDRAFT_146775 [Dictyostelium purpureum]|eukprot:XP_003283151.1 hypothetical protein DICPUDRAFT_146775 [Dictyostelium purpureum]